MTAEMAESITNNTCSCLSITVVDWVCHNSSFGFVCSYPNYRNIKLQRDNIYQSNFTSRKVHNQKFKH